MCKECGCPARGGSQVKFFVRGLAEDNARRVERSLLALPGVYHFAATLPDGLASVFYDPSRTTLAEMTAVLSRQGVQAII